MLALFKQAWIQAGEDLGQLPPAEGPASALIVSMLEPPKPKVDPLVEGLAAYQASRYAEARPLLEQALAQHPSHAEAFEALVRTLMALDAPEDALEWLVKKQHLTRRSANLQYALGEVHLLRGDRESAAAAFGKAIALNDSHTDAYIRLGVLHYEARRHAEARRMLDRAIFLDRAAPVARYYLALTSVELEDALRAQAQLHYLRHVAPDYAPALQLEASLAMKQGHYRQAIAVFNHLADLRALDANAYTELAKAHRAIGNTEEALNAYRNAYTIDRHHWEALSAAAALLEEQRHLDQALALYERLSRSLAHRVPANYAIARIQRAMATMAQAMAGDRQSA
ncbi:MAG TPA: tetratricopeptide repeat protein [Oscillatoriaceae cyanobacterium]